MNWLEIVGTIVGLIYLWLEYKASVWLWIAGIVMPAIYIIVYFQAGLYADFGINIYYLIISFYGLYLWISPKKGEQPSDTPKQIPITKTPHSQYLPLMALIIALTLIFGTILEIGTDSTVPWIDSFTTALSIVGMWMLTRKYIEQWWVWGAVDLISSLLYIYKGLYFTSGLYALYTIIVYFGYRKWLKMMKL